jgi:hypothetical protein
VVLSYALNFRAQRQIDARGHTSYYAEYWVESMVQLVKSTVRGRSTTKPELVAVGALLLKHTLARLKLETPALQVCDHSC